MRNRQALNNYIRTLIYKANNQGKSGGYGGLCLRVNSKVLTVLIEVFKVEVVTS